MKNTQIIFLAFGPRLDLYTQIHFALRSIQMWGEEGYTVTLLTDRVDRFATLKDEVNILPLTADQMQAWRGRHDFMWRIKMKAIEHVANIYPNDHVLYFDSDVVIGKPLTNIFKGLENNQFFMHKAEKVIADSPSSKDKKLTRALQGFASQNYQFDGTTQMYNAGVIAAPAERASTVLADAIELCDALCETAADKTFLEQLAFSMAFYRTGGLREAAAEVIHYWGNKDNWNRIAEVFFIESRLENRTKAEELDAIKQIDVSATPYYYRIQATNRRLKKLIDKCFGKERKTFFG
ncbi:hypothetical protein [Marinomonas epiphytica]